MRLAAVAAVVACVPLLSGCSGADALRAQELLQDASTAQQQLRSERFTGRFTISARGQDIVVKMNGAGYARGRRAGDMYFDLDVESSSLQAGRTTAVRFVRRGGTMSLTTAGRRLALPAPRAEVSDKEIPNLAGFDLARYVTDVKIEEGKVVGGEAAAKVTGVLDTASLMRSLAPLGAATGRPLPDGGAFGDTRVVPYFSTRTHLLLAALVDLTVHADGETVRMHFDLGFGGFNERIAVPAA